MTLSEAGSAAGSTKTRSGESMADSSFAARSADAGDPSSTHPRYMNKCGRSLDR